MGGSGAEFVIRINVRVNPTIVVEHVKRTLET